MNSVLLTFCFVLFINIFEPFGTCSGVRCEENITLSLNKWLGVIELTFNEYFVIFFLALKLHVQK